MALRVETSKLRVERRRPLSFVERRKHEQLVFWLAFSGYATTVCYYRRRDHTF